MKVSLATVLAVMLLCKQNIFVNTLEEFLVWFLLSPLAIFMCLYIFIYSYPLIYQPFKTALTFSEVFFMLPQIPPHPPTFLHES